MDNAEISSRVCLQGSATGGGDVWVRAAHGAGVQQRQQGPQPRDDGLQLQLAAGAHHRHQREVHTLSWH